MAVLRKILYWGMVAGCVLLIGGIIGLFFNPPPVHRSIVEPDEAAFQIGPEATATPFQPQPPTATSIQPTVPGAPVLHFARTLIEDPAEKVVLRIGPAGQVNQGKAIKISFLPGTDCPYGSGRACVSRHREGQVILLTIHSGVGGQGEGFREAVEGNGLVTAGFSLKQIQANLAALLNAPVRVSMGSQSWEPLRIAGVARIPPEEVDDYMNLPFDEALKLAENEPAVRSALESGRPLLAFEICGWTVPGEGWVQGEIETSASIYLGLIQIP